MNMTGNFTQITAKAYIHTQSQSYFVRTISGYELKAAAKAELKKSSSAVDGNGRYVEAEHAFSALQNLLKRRRDSGLRKGALPTYLEASLFAYMFLLLEIPTEKWADSRLVKTLRKFPGLVEETNMMNQEWFGMVEKPEIYDWLLESLI
jgi:metaxin